MWKIVNLNDTPKDIQDRLLCSYNDISHSKSVEIYGNTISVDIYDWDRDQCFTLSMQLTDEELERINYGLKTKN